MGAIPVVTGARPLPVHPMAVRLCHLFIMNKTEVAKRYKGPAEIWVGDAKRSDVLVELTSYIEVETVTTMSGHTERVEGLTSWSGRLTNSGHVDLAQMLGETLELRLPSGRSGRVALVNVSGALQGMSESPF